MRESQNSFFGSICCFYRLADGSFIGHRPANNFRPVRPVENAGDSRPGSCHNYFPLWTDVSASIPEGEEEGKSGESYNVGQSGYRSPLWSAEAIGGTRPLGRAMRAPFSLANFLLYSKGEISFRLRSSLRSELRWTLKFYSRFAR